MSFDPSKYYISPSETYIIKKRNQKYLFVKNDRLSDIEEYMRKNPEMLIQLPTSEIEGYSMFRYSTPFRIQDPLLAGKIYNDCLRLGEELTCGIKNYIGDESILKEKYTGKEFGKSIEANRKIALELDDMSKRTRRSTRGRSTMTETPIAINDQTDPSPGETYAIVKTKPVKIGQHPFHIAHVILRDQDVNITLEANAAHLHLKYPHFYMYSVDPVSENTFHKTWNFMYPDGLTMTLVSRGIVPNYQRSMRASRRHSLTNKKSRRKSRKNKKRHISI
jgi:hypothetical protein